MPSELPSFLWGVAATLAAMLIGFLCNHFIIDNNRKSKYEALFISIYKPLFMVLKDETVNMETLNNTLLEIFRTHSNICPRDFVNLYEQSLPFIEAHLGESYSSHHHSLIKLTTHVVSNYNWFCMKLKYNYQKDDIDPKFLFNYSFFGKLWMVIYLILSIAVFIVGISAIVLVMRKDIELAFLDNASIISFCIAWIVCSFLSYKLSFYSQYNHQDER